MLSQEQYDRLMNDFDNAERMLAEELENLESYYPDYEDPDLFDDSFSFLLNWEDSEPTDSELDTIDNEYSDLDLSSIDSGLVL